MNRLPLADELPYRFVPPRLNPVCLWFGRLTGRRMLCKDHKVEVIDVAGVETLRPLLETGDGVLLCPNHTDHADSHMLFELSRQVGRPFCYMVAYQILQGYRGWFLPRIGAFPVDREGTDLSAFKTAVDILARAKNPLVIFPEGEIHHLGDRVTPLREGALAVATTATKRLGEAGKTVWVVPVALKYRFLEGTDPTPALLDLMDELERRANWWVERDRPIVSRIYRFAEGMMALKEYEYFGESRCGSLPERLAGLREFILERLESRRLPESRRQPAASLNVPERVKNVRRACLDALADSTTTPDDARSLHRDLHDVFVAFQTFSYPGDYLREAPTLERAAETLMKFEEDFLGVSEVTPRGPRRAILRVGEPIDVREAIVAMGKPRLAVPALTAQLERRLQALLDAIGAGRLIEAPEPARESAPRTA
jgi:1-acyl-sn-glycerol-3-phosphate acyltransferase